MVGFLACDKFKAYDYDLISELDSEGAYGHTSTSVPWRTEDPVQ